MRIFDANMVGQGTPEWWELRRGMPTSSDFDRIITPVKGEPSKSLRGYAHALAADVADQRPNWFSERMVKPPTRPILNGIESEPDARRWFQKERNVDVLLVGGILSDCGRFWASTDGIVIADTGCFLGALELKCPLLATQASYVDDGVLPSDYKPQVHGELVVSELPLCTFLSYAPGLPALLLDIVPDEYTAKLRQALDDFWKVYMEVLDKLHLRARFEKQRETTLAHYPEVTQ